MQNKIALEEHFVTKDFADETPDYVNPEAMAEIRRRLLELDDVRLAEMDAAGIERAVLSLTSPGVQGEPDPGSAVERARRSNDELAAAVARHPHRYAGFASVPMQDPERAADELERCVTDLGFKGAMLNGYTTVGSTDAGWYYDHPRYTVFWERLHDLGVPAYLHPRDPLPRNQGPYEGHPELFGAVWTFTVETATHALRLITSGLFDRYPNLMIILGHLGETLPHAMWRIDHRLTFMRHLHELQRPAFSYLRANFAVTTSGNFHTQALVATMSEIGSDNVLFSADYPYESMREAAAWFDSAAISEPDRLKIGRDNAVRLLNLG